MELTRIQKLVVDIADDYVGKKEISGNMGFEDEEMDREMRAIGFEDGQAWCAMVGHLIWAKAYQQHSAYVLPALKKMFSKSATKTLSNARKCPLFTVSKKPQVGALFIMQRYVKDKATWQGHLGICRSFKEGIQYTTFEGNTSSQGGRTGDGFYSLTRSLNVPERPTQLRLKGFVLLNDDIKPEEVEEYLNA